MRALIPPRKLSLPEWIEEHLRLPEGVSALPGRVTLWPYQRDIAAAISDPEIERVTVVKSVRIGYTTLLTAALASYVANEPSPILMLLPTEADCRDFTVSDLEPTFEATPVLRGLFVRRCERKSGCNTLLSRRFAGEASDRRCQAPRNLRRHTARVLMIDECDAMESTAEGNPLTLAERRTRLSPIARSSWAALRSLRKPLTSSEAMPCPICGCSKSRARPAVPSIRARHGS